MFAASCSGGISLRIAFVGPLLIMIGAIGRVDHQLSLGLFLASLLHRHEGINNDTLSLLFLIAVISAECRQIARLVVLVEVMTAIDQHQLAFSSVAGHRARFTVKVAPDVDHSDNDVKRGARRVLLVIGKVAVEIIGDEVALAQQRVGYCVVFVVCDELVGLPLG